MVRESVEAKAQRYLAERRLALEVVTAGEVRGSCRGGDAVYVVSWLDGEGWRCSCLVRGRCCHVVAAAAVVPRGAG